MNVRAPGVATARPGYDNRGSDRIGSLEPGHYADVIAVDVDPLKDGQRDE